MKSSSSPGAEDNDFLRVSWRDGERVFYKNVSDGTDVHRHEAVFVLPSADSAASLDRLTHEYALRDHLDSAWAARPLELVRARGRTMLMIETHGGEPLHHFIGKPMEIETFLRLSIAICRAVSG